MVATTEAPERMFGKAIKRREDPRLITGTAAFLDDVKLADLTHVAILRSPHAHARLRSIDTSAAAAQPGVLGVFTGADLMDINPLPCAWQAGGVQNNVNTPRVLAVDEVHYVGDPNHPQYELGRRQMSGAGNMIAFSVKGGKQGAFDMLRALEIVRISNNLGDAKSLITHPATTTHQRLSAEARAALGIDDGLVRLSVGLEDPQDLVEDLTQALDRADAPTLRAVAAG